MHRKPNRRGQWVAIFAILASALGVIGVGGAFAAANAVTMPLSVTLNACGTGNAATFTSAGNVHLVVNKTPGATECGTPYNTAGVGYADAAVNGVAGSTLPAAAPTFTVAGNTQSDFVFDFELANGDRIWGFPNGTWTAFHGATTLAAPGSYAAAVAAVGATTVTDALFFQSGNATFPADVVVSDLQYANQTLGGGGAVTLVKPADVANVLGNAITAIQLSATTNTSDTHLQYSANNLPAGLAIDKDKGVISGTPTNTGGSLVTVTATNDYGQSASQSFKVTVSAHAPVTLPPFVYGGSVVTVNNNRATVTWAESAKGWPDAGSKCEEVWISGPGFGAWDPTNPTNPGSSHVGFTCDHSGTNTNFGYLSGLAAGHLYALRIVPATGTYGSHKPIPGALVGYVDVFTTR